MPLMHSSLSLYTKCHAANIEHKTAVTQISHELKKRLQVQMQGKTVQLAEELKCSTWASNWV